MRTATLIVPYLGYKRIRVIEKIEYKWKCEIIGSGKELFLFEDEFIFD